MAKKNEEAAGHVQGQNFYCFDTRGGYTIIGEDIYWYGAFFSSGHQNTMRLLKHNTELVEANRSVWEELSRSTDFTHSRVLVLSAGRKICVFFVLEVKNKILTLRGKIYDLYDHTWDNLKCHTTFDYVDHRMIMLATVVENENGSEPNQILFYDLFKGFVMFLDLASREVANCAMMQTIAPLVCAHLMLTSHL